MRCYCAVTLCCFLCKSLCRMLSGTLQSLVSLSVLCSRVQLCVGVLLIPGCSLLTACTCVLGLRQLCFQRLCMRRQAWIWLGGRLLTRLYDLVLRCALGCRSCPLCCCSSPAHLAWRPHGDSSSAETLAMATSAAEGSNTTVLSFRMLQDLKASRGAEF